MAKPKMSAKKKSWPLKKRVASKTKEKEWDMEMFEREARQRTAWGGFVQTMSIIRAEEEENDYQRAKYNNDEVKVKEIEQKRKNRSPLLYIG